MPYLNKMKYGFCITCAKKWDRFHKDGRIFYRCFKCTRWYKFGDKSYYCCDCGKPHNKDHEPGRIYYSCCKKVPRQNYKYCSFAVAVAGPGAISTEG